MPGEKPGNLELWAAVLPLKQNLTKCVSGVLS